MLESSLARADFVLYDVRQNVYLAWFGGCSSQLHVFNCDGKELSVTTTDEVCGPKDSMLDIMFALAYRKMKQGYYTNDSD